ncbi:hypothetical protein CPB84DRAFT_1784947 [Gymnopilus junonius]|uniref:Uncharacterized protein n=1 Tax=Gymnopilus junonius TaxID=109634 RepID=A0A9P5TJZ5_GYMJU|nr:hypothetical protein CPB84DRAFT_1784947 [Gymnopilus junonius]
MTDEPGRDPERQVVHRDYTNLSSLYDITRMGRARIIIGYRGNNVVVPIPDTYEEALKVAFHQLSGYIRSDNWNVNSRYKDAYFLYATPTTTSEPAKLLPDYWNLIVRDGDFLTLCFRSDSEISERNRTVKYIELLHSPSPSAHDRVRMGSVITFPWPASYNAATLTAKTLFYGSKQLSEIFLFVKKGPLEQWRGIDSKVHDHDWKLLTAVNDKEVEIGVWGY